MAGFLAMGFFPVTTDDFLDVDFFLAATFLVDLVSVFGAALLVLGA